MIELSTTSAFMLYLCVTLLTLFSIWGYSHWHSRKQTVFPDDKKLHVCEYCHFVYLGEQTKKITQCPQCLSFNK